MSSYWSGSPYLKQCSIHTDIIKQTEELQSFYHVSLLSPTILSLWPLSSSYNLAPLFQVNLNWPLMNLSSKSININSCGDQTGDAYTNISLHMHRLKPSHSRNLLSSNTSCPETFLRIPISADIQKKSVNWIELEVIHGLPPNCYGTALSQATMSQWPSTTFQFLPSVH